jgi:hypothetical protein
MAVDLSAAACLNDDPREWDEAGSAHAHYVCRFVCTIREQCLTAAKRERPKGQMRANIPFGASKPELTYIDHEAWYELWLSGMSYSAIARKVDRHHTTVMDAVKRLDAQVA